MKAVQLSSLTGLEPDRPRKPSLLRVSLRALHRTSALLLLAFLGLHMVNHAVGLAGQTQHIEFMATVRPLYRNPVVESLLLALLAFQALSGLTMVVWGWRQRRGVVAWLQAASGLYLAAFLLNHVGSVLYGRAGLALDTNFNFAAAGFHVPGLSWFFAPYYFLAIASLFTHLGCAAYWLTLVRSKRLATVLLITLVSTGVAFGALMVAALSGRLYPVDIPARYLHTYQ